MVSAVAPPFMFSSLTYITEVVQQSKARKKVDFLAAFAPVCHPPSGFQNIH
jgi:hypothetical protein